MPNWCYTTYHFQGKENELKILHDKINEWTSKQFIETAFGDSWLGNILYGAGLQDCINNPDPARYLACRGQIVDITDRDGNILRYSRKDFTVSTETAWVPMAKMWNAVIEKLGLKSVEFSFCAEESGCEIYWIYDPHNHKYFIDEVYIDAYGTEELDDMDRYCSEGEAIECLNKFFHTDLDNLSDFQTLCEDYNEKHEQDDCFISFHRFEIDNELQD